MDYKGLSTGNLFSQGVRSRLSIYVIYPPAQREFICLLQCLPRSIIITQTPFFSPLLQNIQGIPCTLLNEWFAFIGVTVNKGMYQGSLLMELVSRQTNQFFSQINVVKVVTVLCYYIPHAGKLRNLTFRYALHRYKLLPELIQNLSFWKP